MSDVILKSKFNSSEVNDGQKLESNSTKQLNLKISNNLMEKIEVYSEEFGYNNAQELIREAIRDKIFGSDNVRSDYLERLFTDSEFQTSIGKKQSIFELNELQKRIEDK